MMIGTLAAPQNSRRQKNLGVVETFLPWIPKKDEQGKYWSRAHSHAGWVA